VRGGGKEGTEGRGGGGEREGEGEEKALSEEALSPRRRWCKSARADRNTRPMGKSVYSEFTAQKY
jgi:hypothetical protein